MEKCIGEKHKNEQQLNKHYSFCYILFEFKQFATEIRNL